MARVQYICGASGTGKSTLAQQVRQEQTLGLDHRVEIISTDVLRAQLRAVLTRTDYPELWAESFNVPFADGVVVDPNQVNIDGFLRQCAPILRAVEAGVQYMLTEGWDVIVEGVHLVPGQYAPASSDQHEVVVTMCEAQDAETHRQLFAHRDTSTRGARPAQHYQLNLARIQQIQQLLSERFDAAPMGPTYERKTVLSTDIST